MLDDGSSQTLRSGDGWFARHGPIVYDHVWHGEIYDSRLETNPAWDDAPLAAFPAGVWSVSWLVSIWGPLGDHP